MSTKAISTISDITDKDRVSLCLFFGIDPKDAGKSGGAVVSIAKAGASIGDTFTLGIPVTSYIVNTAVLKAALSYNLIATAKEMGADMEYFPRNHEEVNMVIKEYEYSRLGERDSEHDKGAKSKFTDDQTMELAKMVTDQKDFLFGQKLVRLLGLGSHNNKLRTNSLYKWSYRNVPGFGTVFGGSKTLGIDTINYLGHFSITYDEVKDTITNFKKKWADYLNKVLMSVRLKADKFSEKRLSEKLGSSKSNSVKTDDSLAQN